MNIHKWLLAEFMVSVGLTSWAALTKNKAWPYPPTIIRTGVAFILLSFLALASAELAGVLGAGLLLAQILQSPIVNNKFVFGSGIPTIGSTFPYTPLVYQVETAGRTNLGTSGSSSTNPAGTDLGGSVPGGAVESPSPIPTTSVTPSPSPTPTAPWNLGGAAGSVL